MLYELGVVEIGIHFNDIGADEIALLIRPSVARRRMKNK
jgi:hypothetical protein